MVYYLGDWNIWILGWISNYWIFLNFVHNWVFISNSTFFVQFGSFLPIFWFIWSSTWVIEIYEFGLNFRLLGNFRNLVLNWVSFPIQIFLSSNLKSLVQSICLFVYNIQVLLANYLMMQKESNIALKWSKDISWRIG